MPLRPSQLHALLLPTLAAALFLLMSTFIVYLIRKLFSKHAATSPSSALLLPRRFSHSVLRRATSSFSEANRLGKGGVGSVYRGVLPDGRNVAVKVMDSGSLQGGREFRNEILLAKRIVESERVLSVLGYAAGKVKEELVLVYELMMNGSLQDALLYRKCVELSEWKVRFGIVMDVAEGIYFMHFVCDPPVVHCDIKASNVLLDCRFRAKLADFGLACVKCGKGCYCQTVDMEELGCGSGRFGDGVWMDSACKDLDLEMSLSSLGSGGGGTECIGSEVMGRPMSEAGGYLPDRGESAGCGLCDEVKIHIDEKHRRLPREWWKEEFSAELTSKGLKKRELEGAMGGRNDKALFSPGDNESISAANKTRKNIIDWCTCKLNFEILKKQTSRHVWASGDLPKSHCVASTPSMKGTVCYTAPEFSCSGQLSEKCDIYSFGVLLLVLISGRRPLEMTSSPMKDFERANLVTWARQLAQDDKLLDLVDPNIKSLDKEQAMRCLTVALLCLQRSPAKRPSAKEIIQLLSNSSNPLHLTLHSSPELHLGVHS